MESGDSGVTSPVLRVTAEISELKGSSKGRDGGKYSISPSSVASKDGRNNLFSKKKILHPLYGCNPYQRSNYAGSYISSHQNAKNNVSSFTQRVMSAKLLRVKQLQNQLAETQLKLNEVLNENKTLRTLQQRQDNVLKKYEGNQEQLPHLLKSHHEEIRILTEKYKQLRSNYRELEMRMKQKDHELTNLREQYKHLLKLSRDKQLGDREKLTKKVEELESIIEQQRKKIYTLDKKLALEEKNHRYQLQQEITKHKKTQSELNSALESLNNLKSAMEVKERFANTSYPRFLKSAQNPQIQDKASKPSHVSLPAPPRVSIRQNQRLAQSASALQQEDSETPDSFTLNYSPEARGNTSTDSDNTSTGSKEDAVKRSTNFTAINQPNEVINRPAVSVQGGIHISKEAFRRRREKRRAEERKALEAQLQNNKTEENITENENKLLKSPTKESSSMQVSKNQDNAEFDLNETKNYKRDEVGNTSPILGETNISKTNAQGAITYSPSHEDTLFVEIEKEVNAGKSENEMKIDVDKEFEQILQGTRLSDEAISEYYQRDFRAEIFELEKKFQDLNKVSEKYIHRDCKMNGVSYHIPVSDESDTEDEGTTNESVVWNPKMSSEVEVNSELRNRTRDHLELQNKQSGPSLGESQKASLLKALSNIDEANKGASRGSDQSASNNSTNHDGLIADNTSDPDKSAHSFSRTKRKSEIMKDLFGIEGAAH